jgi:hypothetical protein
MKHVLMTEAPNFSETSNKFNQTTRRHTPEDRNLYNDIRDNLNSQFYASRRTEVLEF